MKTKRRAVLKGLIAGAAGFAGLVFANNTKAKAVHFEVAGSARIKKEPTKYTRNGNLVFISGIGCYEGPMEIKAHTAVAMRDLKATLEEAGSSMDKVLKCVVYIDDIANYAPMNSVYNPAFTKGRPARSCIAVPKGGIPGNSLLKVDAIAYL